MSLYYGAQILNDAYKQPNEYELDPNEKAMVFIFVGSEVASGAAMAIQLIALICCGELTKSQHLNEIQGEGFNVDMNQVNKIKEELQMSRERSSQVVEMVPMQASKGPEAVDAEK